MKSDENKNLFETDKEKFYKLMAARLLCEEDHLFFSRYFFKSRQEIKFRVNWHHELISDTVQDIINGKIKNVVINVPPGSSKTELVVINLIARGLAINPRSRFLHLSGSDTLASLNSATARDIITSDAYQELWPLKIAEDAKSKKRWNILVDGQAAGGVYATSLGGQITGFRAGHMAEGFQGAIIIDDPNKPEDAFSKSKLDAANRKLVTTIKSRKANPNTPIIVIMQRIAEMDVTGFIKSGAVDGDWHFINIPAVLDETEVAKIPEKYQLKIDRDEADDKGRISYWPYKEPLKDLVVMERGGKTDQAGATVSRFVFASQYQQTPTSVGGNIIKGEYFRRYNSQATPRLKYRQIIADTAQKTADRNDFSVFLEVGLSVDNQLILLDLIRGKWEAPELQRRAVSFWSKAKNRESDKFGHLRNMLVEDKSSGTGLIQTIKLPPHNIPILPVQREKDKLTRVMDVLTYIEVGMVWVPEDLPFTNDLIAECEAFSPDDSHAFDDQVDTLIDAVNELLSTNNKMKVWEQLAKKD